MTELSPETRAFLEATAGGDGPSADDRARIRQRLAVELGAAALATTTLAVAAQATAASSLSTAATSIAVGKASAGAGVSFLGKIAIAAAVAGAVSSSAVIALQSLPSSAGSTVSASRGAPTHEPKHASARPAELPEPGVTALEAVAAPLAPAVQPGVLAAEELAAPQPARARSREAKRAAPTAESNMAEELALLRQAQTALREGRAVDALRVTTDHAARFPQGALREERAAVDMLARCAQGSANAERLASFLDAAPESPLKARVRQACKIEP